MQLKASGRRGGLDEGRINGGLHHLGVLNVNHLPIEEGGTY